MKALYIVTSDFRGKLYLSFLITDILLLTFIITLSTCCLKFSFSSSKTPRSFWYGSLTTWTLFIFMVGLVGSLFLKNNTSWAGLLESGLKSLFQLKTQFWDEGKITIERVSFFVYIFSSSRKRFGHQHRSLQEFLIL